MESRRHMGQGKTLLDFGGSKFFIFCDPHIIVSGEAVLNGENSGKPLGGRGSARPPLVKLGALPRPFSW